MLVCFVDKIADGRKRNGIQAMAEGNSFLAVLYNNKL
jgi:hypothetical protein